MLHALNKQQQSKEKRQHKRVADVQSEIYQHILDLKQSGSAQHALDQVCKYF